LVDLAKDSVGDRVYSPSRALIGGATTELVAAPFHTRYIKRGEGPARKPTFAAPPHPTNPGTRSKP